MMSVPRPFLRWMFAFALVALGATKAAAQPANGAHVTTEHSRATLMLSKDRAAPGETLWAALKLELDPGWHTYWRNAGDSGLAGSIEWTLPAGMSAGEIAWPTPERVPYGPLMNFGYSDRVILPVPITLSPDMPAPQTVTLAAKAQWLVCADICIPDEGGFSVSLTLDTAGPGVATADAPEIAQALAALPQPAPWPVALRRTADAIELAAGPGLTLADNATVEFFPFDGGLIDNAAPQEVRVESGRLTLRVAAAPVPLDLQAQTGGVLAVIPAQAGEPRAAYSFMTTAPPAAPSDSAAVTIQGEPLGLMLAVAFAFLGGLILNLMPCVLPVLAMKGLSLVGQGEAAAERRRDGVLYALGVMTTFGLLAVALLGLRSAGAEIGWGFQLQSPPVVAVLAYILLALGLSLSGVFTIGGGVMGAGQGLTARGGGAGAFFTGALAVVVATPCTAPFMGAAMGFAMTQPALDMFVVFQGLALGLAAPFLALSFVPGLARRLPRPGPWMDRLKQALAFPMYASAAWLAWVLSQQIGPEGFAAALAGLVLVGLAGWAFGLVQGDLQSGPGRPWLSMAAGLVSLIGALALIATVARAPGIGTVTAASADANAEVYSAARVEALRAEGRPVFVNFTAAWCITCLMNERVALGTEEVKAAFAQSNVAYLKADWTNRDPAITAALASFGRNGVPLYVVYPTGRGAPMVLPQLLTPGAVLAAIGAV